MKPNLLLILTDQQSGNMLSCAGTPWVHTPALDGLAAEGVRFDHAYCTNPVCVPSRISMATGKMPCRLGAADNSSGTNAILPESMVDQSLGMLMKRAGYDTFFGGKVHMCPQLDPRHTGYDIYHANERETLADACIHFLNQNHAHPIFAVASFINPHDICYAHNAKANRQPQLDHVRDLYRQACGLSDEQLPPLPDNFAMPDHEPAGFAMRRNTRAITPSGTMSESYTERDWRIYRWIYARLTEQVDTQIGRILTALKTSGQEDNTVVIFSSDHGNMQGNHGLASKMAFYEESVRVPFLMKYPGHIPASQVDVSHLVSTGLDLLPTCCEIAEIAVPVGLHGISQMGAARGDTDSLSREFVVAENGNGRMLRTQRWKYTVYEGAGQRETLTDLKRDPGELQNMALQTQHQKNLQECRGLLRTWFEKTGDADGLRSFAIGNVSGNKP